MKLTLYYAPIACSLVPLATLHEAGAQFEAKPISLKDGGQKSAEFLRLSPKSKVPVLVIDGEPLTENVAILTWIAGAFPDKKLLPADPRNWIKALSLMAWCGSGMHPRFHKTQIPPFPNYAAHAESNHEARQHTARARLRARGIGAVREGRLGSRIRPHCLMPSSGMSFA